MHHLFRSTDFLGCHTALESPVASGTSRNVRRRSGIRDAAVALRGVQTRVLPTTVNEQQRTERSYLPRPTLSSPEAGKDTAQQGERSAESRAVDTAVHAGAPTSCFSDCNTSPRVSPTERLGNWHSATGFLQRLCCHASHPQTCLSPTTRLFQAVRTAQ